MAHATTVEIEATPDAVWQILVDVEHWPDWSDSMTAVERLKPGPLEVGSSARVKQPRLPWVVWRVTALQPGRSFDWVSEAPGATTKAGHRIEESPRAAG